MAKPGLKAFGRMAKPGTDGLRQDGEAWTEGLRQDGEAWTEGLSYGPGTHPKGTPEGVEPTPDPPKGGPFLGRATSKNPPQVGAAGGRDPD